jgi:hypothetical protein
MKYREQVLSPSEKFAMGKECYATGYSGFMTHTLRIRRSITEYLQGFFDGRMLSKD